MRTLAPAQRATKAKDAAPAKTSEAPVQAKAAPDRTTPAGTYTHSLDRLPVSQRRPAPLNRTGLPDHLKSGVEALSGVSLDAVKVHYNSARPAQLKALAYAQGTDIHLGRGQERHLPHEAWHVVQQTQGRVRANTQMAGGVPISDDARLEREADIMGAKAATQGASASPRAPLVRPAIIGPAPLQRLVGFEGELSVPSLGPPPAAVDYSRLAVGPDGDHPTPAIEQLFFGGLPYGVNRGAGGSFTLKPDHNELQGKGRAIRVKLAEMNLLLKAPADTTSNLEYVTHPLDELAAGSTTNFNVQFNAIRDHANALFPTAKTSILALGAPAVSTYTGVPEADLRTWLGAQYNQIQGLVDDFKASVKNEFYIQATVGILPSAIRELHARHTPAQANVRSVTDLAMYAVKVTIDNMVANATFQAKPYVRELQVGRLGGMFGIGAKPARPIDYEVFLGVLHLAYMYMVGSALNQTSLFDGSSSKNAVPFLSKMSNMRDIVSKAAPSLHADRPPGDLITFIDTYFKRTRYTGVQYWLDQHELLLQDRRGQEGRGPTVGDTFLSDLLVGQWGESVLGGPQVHAVSSPRSFDEPDTLPDPVSRASGGQRAAQFEYRYIRTKPAADGLATELKKVIDEVRALNLRHMGGVNAQLITNAADV